MSYLLENVEARALELGATKVLSINLVMGDRSTVVDDSLLFYFDMLSPGTVVEGAKINVRRTPMRFHCAYCKDDYAPISENFDCPRCGNVGQVTDDGSELLIESIEIET